MSRWVLALPWVVGSLLAGCGGDKRNFGPNEDPNTDEDAGDATRGDAGADAATSAPMSNSAADGGGSTSGPLASESRQDGGELTTLGETDGGSTADTSGDQTGTVPAGPTLDGACSKGGVRACDVNDSKQTLVCSQGRWQSNGGCAKKDNCDPSAGACSEIVPGCNNLAEGARYCQPGDQLWECGPNLVSETLVETCEGNCVPDGETSECASPECGDGKTQANETCDDANDDNEDACTILCKPPECGDGIPHSSELCDDGDEDEDDECTSLCAPPACGDGFTQSGELCDDGNDDQEDACTTLCRPPGCGDGFAQSGESCDDGNDDENDTCTSLCEAPGCGDGFTQMWEACDDGNVDYGDGCSHLCAFEVVDVASGFYHTCALRADGRVKCWGYGAFGQLGIGGTNNVGNAPYQMGPYLPEVDLGVDRRAVQLALGYVHACVLLENRHVKCWGYNGSGQLGLGDTVARGDGLDEMGDTLLEVDLGADVTVEEIAAGSDHTCARLSDGRVKCWGNSYYGQLGYGDTSSRGVAPEQMGDSLPAVDLGEGRTARKIAAGANYTCALLDDFGLKCWGDNYNGQLGQGHADAVGNAADQMGDNLPPIDLGVGRVAIDVFAGYNHTCAILDDSALKCWGYNGFGQLGQADTAPRGDNAGEMGDALLAIDVGMDRTAVGVALGYENSCVLLDNHDVKCWGYGSYGMPGQGTTDAWGDQIYEMGDFLPIVPLGVGRSAQKLTAGNYHACALLVDGGVKCWGYNSEGELGQGHSDHRGNAPDQMGDNLWSTSLW